MNQKVIEMGRIVLGPDGNVAAKMCFGCMIVKPIGEFNKKASSPDGYRTQCKACEAARKREYAAKPKPELPPDATKTCTKCGKTKPIAEFSKKASSPDGHRTQCKACRAATLSYPTTPNADARDRLERPCYVAGTRPEQ